MHEETYIYIYINMKVEVFRAVAPCSVVVGYQRFRGPPWRCRRLYDGRVNLTCIFVTIRHLSWIHICSSWLYFQMLIIYVLLSQENNEVVP